MGVEGKLAVVREINSVGMGLEGLLSPRRALLSELSKSLGGIWCMFMFQSGKQALLKTTSRETVIVLVAGFHRQYNFDSGS